MKTLVQAIEDSSAYSRVVLASLAHMKGMVGALTLRYCQEVLFDDASDELGKLPFPLITWVPLADIYLKVETRYVRLAEIPEIGMPDLSGKTSPGCSCMANSRLLTLMHRSRTPAQSIPLSHGYTREPVIKRDDMSISHFLLYREEVQRYMDVLLGTVGVPMDNQGVIAQVIEGVLQQYSC